ncbi:glycosyltransferase family 4 protein [Poritiphilus flavus]|uniref:Glycosyltransferase n=1 Tax=Poritiphilus flavus TaxID=2697053 RepID=A0A6L9EC90_9FLAO|nr:glycosyltransferase family 4 protein [Poritiphilus flavus]NAS12364.1 glycosyltransferase [Poritiphilus flavus]
MSKRALFVYSNYDFALKNVGSTRMRYYAGAVADQDTKVYLVSCTSGELNDDFFEEVSPNVFKPKDNKLQSYGVWASIKFLRRLFRFSKLKGDSRAFIFYPSHRIALEIIAILYLKLIKRQRVFTEYNEVRKYTASFHNPLSIRKPVYSLKRIIYRTVFSCMELLLPLYNGLICISTEIQKYGSRFNKNTVRIPILTDPYTPLEVEEGTYANPEVFNIGFSGSIHLEKERLQNFFEVISQLKKKGFELQFNLCGQVKKDQEDYIFNRLLKDLEIDSSVNFCGYLHKEALSSFLKQQELLVIPRGFTLQNKYGFSTKLSDYLNHKKPVLVTDVSDNGKFIKDKINGFIVPPDNDEAMLEKLVYIIENYKDFYEEVVAMAHKTSEDHFYYKRYGEALKNFLFAASEN